MKLIKRSFSLIITLALVLGMGVSVFADEDTDSVNYDSVRAFVERLYIYCLGRSSDEDGLAYWTDSLAAGQIGGYEAARGFFDSLEFIESERSDEEFVTVCYNTLLGRAPDPQGLVYWTGFLENGTKTRDDIVSCFCNSDEYLSICEQYGIQNRVFDPREQYPEASAVLDQIVWDLRAAYDWTRDSITYVRDINVDHRYTSRELAHRGFSARNGNCFVFSACFYELACALGYDAHQMTGHITRSTGLVVIHSWVEIDIDGTTWVFDPEFEFVDKVHRDGWYFQYGRRGTFVYQDITRMN